MKRLAMAAVVLTALATLAQAGGLPKPIRLVERMKTYDATHYVRGAQGGGGSGGYDTPTAEARRDLKGDVKGTKTAKKATPQPARAD